MTRCRTCGYLKPPEKLGGDVARCVGCGGHRCTRCGEVLPRPGTTLGTIYTTDPATGRPVCGRCSSAERVDA